MTKFNGYERQLIRDALSNHSIALENEVQDAVEAGKNPIFAEGFFEMTIKELLSKVDTMTLKRDLK